MQTSITQKTSLVKYAMYSIGLNLAILLGQLYIIIKNILPSKPIFIGPIHLPLLISSLLLVLLIAVGMLTMKQWRNREAKDELADLNNYKAGYITKYICMFVAAITIILVKDFGLILREDAVGNALSIIVICLSFTELVHNIVFIILEKVQ